MDEAEKLCGRVAIVDHGKVIALGTPAELIAQIGGEHFIEFKLEADATLAEEDVKQLPSVVHLRREADGWCVAVTAVHVTLPALLELLNARSCKLVQLTTR